MKEYEIVEAVNKLAKQYRDDKRGVDLKEIPPSSLWLELKFAVTWQQLDAAIASVAGAPLGVSYSPTWLKEHAGEIADRLTDSPSATPQ